jgi:hypothetical protein
MSPAAKFAPSKVTCGRPHSPTHHCTRGLADVSTIAPGVTVIVPEENVTLPPDPFPTTEYVTEPVVDVGVTVVVPLQVTAPLALPSVAEMVQPFVAFAIAIVSVKLVPSVTLFVEGVTDPVGGGALTVTVAVSLTVPPALVAVTVYDADGPAGGVADTLPVRLELVVRPGPETEQVVAVPQFH